MPLDPDGLQDALEDFFAEPSVVLKPDGTADIPASKTACANEWGAIMADYAADIVPPSGTVSSAAATLAGALEAAFALPDTAAPAAIDTAFLAFATAVGAGMALETPPFTPTPPAAPPGFASQLLTMQPTHAAAAAAFTLLIDTWMKTGTAVPAGGGPAVPWS